MAGTGGSGPFRAPSSPVLLLPFLPRSFQSALSFALFTPSTAYLASPSRFPMRPPSSLAPSPTVWTSGFLEPASSEKRFVIWWTNLICVFTRARPSFRGRAAGCRRTVRCRTTSLRGAYGSSAGDSYTHVGRVVKAYRGTSDRGIYCRPQRQINSL